jgi:hypothetical protein
MSSELPDRLVSKIKPSIASHALIAFWNGSLYGIPPTAYETSPDIHFIASSFSVSRMNLFSHLIGGFTGKVKTNLKFDPLNIYSHVDLLGGYPLSFRVFLDYFDHIITENSPSASPSEYLSIMPYCSLRGP